MATIVKTYFSNRIYKNTLSSTNVDIISKALYTFNAAKFKTYSLVNKDYNNPDKSLHIFVKEHFGFNDYFANSVIQEAKGVHKSNVELNKLYISNTKSQIDNKINKIKSIEKKIKYNKAILKHFKEISYALHYNKKLPKLKNYINIQLVNLDGSIFVFRKNTNKKYKDSKQYFSLYEYETTILKPYIKKLKNRISKIKEGLNISKQKLNNLENRITHSCFGSKDLFKKQYTTYENNHTNWKQDFHNVRNRRLIISGRKDATQGNFCFRYNDKTLTFKSYDNTKMIFPLVYFPYGQDIVELSLKTKGYPVAWAIEDFGDYYIIKVTLNVLVDIEQFNNSKADGIVSYDTNVDHLAWSNLDSKGNLLNYGTIPFDLDNKTTGQSAKILEKVAIQMVNIAKYYKKPLVGELLDTEKSKSTLKYGNKKKNKQLSVFAYQKIISVIKNVAYKNKTEVFYVNAAYTSQIGKMKYMRNKGLSIHVSAAYTIGRRGLGMKDKVPKELKHFVDKNKHHWSQWNTLYRGLKEVHVFKFYNKYDKFNTLKELKEKMIG